ncbi:hypothetical protein Efla_002965 [Eimeria flavescens]
MFGMSHENPSRVKPAKLRPPKPQPPQQQPLHTRQQQHALFIQARKAAAAAAAAAQQQQLQQQPSLGVPANVRQSSLSVADKAGRLVAVTTYSGSLEDYLLLHSTDESCSASNSDISSPLRGTSEEDLRSRSNNLWEAHLRQQQQQQQQQDEQASEAKDSRKVSSNSRKSSQEEQQQEAQETAPLQQDNQQQEQQQQQQEEEAVEQQQQQQQQQQQNREEGSSPETGSRFIVPPTVRTPDGVEKRQWPAMTISLLPPIGELEDVRRLAAFAQSAAEVQRFANLPIEAVSPAAAALKLQQRLRQQQLRRQPLHFTIREGLNAICNKFKPQEGGRLPPIKLPVYFSEPEEAGGGLPAAGGPGAPCSRDCSSTARQPSSNCQSSHSGRGVSSSSSSSSSGQESSGPFEEEVYVQLDGGMTGKVVAITEANHVVIKLPVSLSIPAAAAAAAAALASVCRVSKTAQTVEVDEPALDAPACALFSPGICQPRVIRKAEEQKAAFRFKPDVSTSDLVRAPGIVRPLYANLFLSPLLHLRFSSPCPRLADIVHPPAPKTQQRALASPQQQQQQQQQQASFVQVPQLAEAGGPAVGPAAAAAAELDLVGQKWFCELQSNMRQDMLQQYVDTAPPVLCGGIAAAAALSGFQEAELTQQQSARRTARVLRDELQAIPYALNNDQQQQQQQQ